MLIWRVTVDGRFNYLLSCCMSRYISVIWYFPSNASAIMVLSRAFCHWLKNGFVLKFFSKQTGSVIFNSVFFSFLVNYKSMTLLFVYAMILVSCTGHLCIPCSSYQPMLILDSNEFLWFGLLYLCIFFEIFCYSRTRMPVLSYLLTRGSPGTRGDHFQFGSVFTWKN